MADAEVVQDPYLNHSPTAFDQAQIETLKATHGVKLTWANRRWRSEHRGWHGLQRVPADLGTDLAKDAIKCLKQPIIDMEMQSRDGWICHGDLVLCSQTMVDKEQRNAHRDYLANRKLRSLNKGTSELTDEIAKVTKGHVRVDAEVTGLKVESKKMVTNSGMRSTS